MKASNIIKKLEKTFNVTVASETTRCYVNYSVKIGTQVVSFHTNVGSDDVSNVHVRYEHDHSDSMTDYFAGTFLHTIKGVVNWVQRDLDREAAKSA